MRIAALMMAALLLVACNEKVEHKPPPQPAAWAHPQPAGASDGAVYPGRVVASVEAPLAFRTGGRIIRRMVEAGDNVKAGQPLAKLDASDAAAQLAAARAGLAKARADAELAEDELKRYRFLNQRDEVSDSALQMRQTQAAAARSQLQSARSQVDLAQNQAHYTTLRAPAAGVITERLLDVGAVVAPGQPVFNFAEHGGREVDISVPEGQLEALRKAPQLWVTLWALPGKRYAGKLREVAPAADNATRSHSVRVNIEGADAEVNLGMSAAVMVPPAAGGNWFRVPLTAVEGARDQAQVWVIDDKNRVTPVPVQVKRLTEQDAVVAGKLESDSRVVAAGAERLVKGQVVRPIERNKQLSLP